MNPHNNNKNENNDLVRKYSQFMGGWMAAAIPGEFFRRVIGVVGVLFLVRIMMCG